MKKITILFAALAALVSCNKENPVTPEAQEAYSFSLTAVAPNHGADTKTTLVGEGDDKLVHWTKGDAIKLLFFAHGAKNYVKYTSQGQVLTSVSTEPTAEETKFRIENWPTSGKDIINDRAYFKDMGIAVYPSSATAYSEKYDDEYGDYFVRSEVSFVLPEEQVAVEDNFQPNLNFSYAPVELDAFLGKKTAEPVAFKNACALIRLTMPETLDKKVTSISLVSNSGGFLAGKGTVELNAGNDEIAQNMIKSPFGVSISGGTGVTLSCEEGFVAGAQYYAVVWPGAHEGLTITFTAEDGTVAAKTTGAVNLTASSIKGYNIKSLEFGSGEDIVEPVQVGSFYYSDGTWSTELKAGKTVAGVVFYAGNPHDKDNTLPESCLNGMAISVKHLAEVRLHSANLPNTDYTSYGLGSPSGKWGYDAKLTLSKLYGNFDIYSYDYGENLEHTEVKTLGIYESREIAENHLSLGDYGYFKSDFVEFGSDMIKSKALDDRLGCAIMLELLSEKSKIDYTCVFTVQEEVGCRGAITATNRVKPDYAIVLEATTAADVAFVNPE